MKLLFVIITLALAGCGKVWRVRHISTTQDERDRLAAHIEKVVSRTPGTLAGNDQDWDDAIRVAYALAPEVICRPTLWELDQRAECEGGF